MAKNKKLPHPMVLRAGEFIVPTIIAFAIIVSIIIAFTALKDQTTDENLINVDTEAITNEITEIPEGIEVGITVLKEGKGESAKTGDTVSVNYTGTYTDGEVFDSSVGRDPFELTLGMGQVIPGWEQGLLGMKPGEKRKLEIPYLLAYGETGFIDPYTGSVLIPPKTDLVFEVELLEIK